MMKLRFVLGVVAVLASVIWAASATADPASVPICAAQGTPISGLHTGNVTITGNAYVPDGSSLTVTGNLTLAPGACLDAFTLANVTVNGNVLVKKGAVLGLGCSPGALGPPLQPPCEGQTTTDVVGGNIVANQPLTMYLTAVTVHGNVVSSGGGGQAALFMSYPIKENTIGGNLIVQGWQGAWFGALRNHVAGNAIFTNNSAFIPGLTGQGPDSTELATNTISGNLICLGNSPAAQFGDAEGATPNVVSGNAIGECGFGVIPAGASQPISVKG
jgi:hypothetical protein